MAAAEQFGTGENCTYAQIWATSWSNWPHFATDTQIETLTTISIN